jgi:hypothetical protein
VLKLGEVVMILDLHRQGLSVSAIARDLGLDRKTVRRCIARGLEPPVYGPRKPRARLIVDEIGYLPVIPGGGNLFFQLVNARYEKGAMILTSNRSFAEWGEVFGEPVVATALLDRLLHHAVVVQIEGSSYRLRQHADLMPEHTRTKAVINTPIPAPPARRRGRPPKNGASDHAAG